MALSHHIAQRAMFLSLGGVVGRIDPRFNVLLEPAGPGTPLRLSCEGRNPVAGGADDEDALNGMAGEVMSFPLSRR